MTEQQIACTNAGCGRKIQPATAKRTGGLCAPCHAKQAAEERAAYIKANRTCVNRYEGVNDPVDMLAISFEHVVHDPLVVQAACPKPQAELFGALDAKQCKSVMELAIQHLNQGDTSTAEDIARCLACFTSCDLEPLIVACLQQGQYWPPVMFRNASPATANHLIQSMHQWPDHADAFLQCLVWIDADAVVECLLDGDKNKPAWVQSLHVSPNVYAHIAGWEIRDGKRHNLYNETCFALHAMANGADINTNAKSCIQTMQPCSQPCPACKQPLQAMVKWDRSDPRMTHWSAALPNPTVMTCSTCAFNTSSGITFEPAQGNTWQWSDKNQCPQSVPDDIQENNTPWSNTHVRLEARNPLHAADWSLPTQFSQIGGLPTWVHDAAYPTCHACNQTMTFLAQLEDGDGLLHAFVCPKCRSTCTTCENT